MNALAPLLLTLALMTSRMGSIDDNSSGNSLGYPMAKLAPIMAVRSLVH